MIQDSVQALKQKPVFWMFIWNISEVYSYLDFAQL